MDPAEVRRSLFAGAAAARREATARGAFDRAAVLEAEARARACAPDELERALYADLAEAHLLRAVAGDGPETLLAAYELARYQAVLLRAVRLRATVRAGAPGAYRHLFRRLKFLRLLHRIERLPEPAGYAIEIDGPYSLFESVTRYGLQLALALPALMGCEAWTVEADLRWGQDRRPMRFRMAGGSGAAASARSEAAGLPDEVAALLGALAEMGGPWRASMSDAVLDVPGLGVCVPDLELVHGESGRRVFVEVLGFWSREAVWRRVELARRGLPSPIVFAVSKHLRVSEAALEEDLPAALYVYGRSLSARALLERAEAVAARS